MRENFKKLESLLLEDNTNLKVIDRHIHLSKVLGKEPVPEAIDKDFTVIRKNKKYSMSMDFQKLRKHGFEVVNIGNFNGKDEVYIRFVL